MMALVYAVDKQQSIQIGNYGFATHDKPCLVPDELAASLEKEPGLRVVRDAKPKVIEVGDEPSRDFVERIREQAEKKREE
jgi:hypothetical protein